MEELQKDLDPWLIAYNHEVRSKGRCAADVRQWQRSRTADESAERRQYCNLIEQKNR